MVAGPVPTRAGSEPVAPLRVVEHQQAGHRVREQRDGAHHLGRDEGQRALAADHQVGEDVDRAGRGRAAS